MAFSVVIIRQYFTKLIQHIAGQVSLIPLLGIGNSRLILSQNKSYPNVQDESSNWMSRLRVKRRIGLM